MMILFSILKEYIFIILKTCFFQSNFNEMRIYSYFDNLINSPFCYKIKNSLIKFLIGELLS